MRGARHSNATATSGWWWRQRPLRLHLVPLAAG